jgi:hypothetical protein
MTEKYKIDALEGKYFVTLTVVHWIDSAVELFLRERN